MNERILATEAKQGDLIFIETEMAGTAHSRVGKVLSMRDHSEDGRGYVNLCVRLGNDELTWRPWLVHLNLHWDAPLIRVFDEDEISL